MPWSLSSFPLRFHDGTRLAFAGMLEPGSLKIESIYTAGKRRGDGLRSTLDDRVSETDLMVQLERATSSTKAVFVSKEGDPLCRATVRGSVYFPVAIQPVNCRRLRYSCAAFRQPDSAETSVSTRLPDIIKPYYGDRPLGANFYLCLCLRVLSYKFY